MPSPSLSRTLVSLLLLSAAASATEARWQTSLWDRNVMPDDLVLPLPCEGAMAFRPILVGSEDDRLSDLRVELGSAAPDALYAEFPRSAHIAGSISDEGAADRRLYYLGKYEVTRDQYAAVMQPDCPKPSPSGGLPQEKISWFDAIAFTQKLSEWLLSEAPDWLPKEDGVATYLRLPTETEWEFAARGGMAVTDSQRRDLVFPMPDGSVERYAWFDSPDSCDGDSQPVGLKRPNPLGLFDMLGNVEEMVLTPYQMTVAGRLHGQVGGFVTKGGSCNTRRELLRSGARREHPFFDAHRAEAKKPEFAGFRVALVAPVETSVPRIEDLREDWQKAGRRRGLDPESDPLTILGVLAEEAEDPERRTALERVSAGFSRERQQRNALDARSARMAIIAGAQMIRGYRRDERIVRAVEKAIAACGGDETCRERTDAGRLSRAKLNAEIGANALLDLIGQVQGDYPQSLLASQLVPVLEQYAAFESGGFAGFASGFVRLIAAGRESPERSNAEILQAVLGL